jgi:hypothetical protein
MSNMSSPLCLENEFSAVALEAGIVNAKRRSNYVLILQINTHVRLSICIVYSLHHPWEDLLSLLKTICLL